MEVSYLEHNGYVTYEETEEDKLWTMYCDYMDCNQFNLCGNLMTYKEYAESVTYTDTVCQVTMNTCEASMNVNTKEVK